MPCHAPGVLTPVAGKPALLLAAYDLAPLGYQAEEFFLAGLATRYATPAANAAYKTRAVVVRRSDPARFNGTVLVEWPNVTSGLQSASFYSVGRPSPKRSSLPRATWTANEA
jgi:hypothetical protein